MGDQPCWHEPLHPAGRPRYCLTASSRRDMLRAARVMFLKLEWLCYEHFAGVCPLEGMCTIPIVSFDVEHDLIDQILF